MASIDITREAFNTKQACAITGMTPRKIRYLDDRGVVKPSIAPARGRGSRRLYSYADLLALRTVKSLRSQGVSLQKVRRCVLFLRKRLRNVSQPLGYCTLITVDNSVWLVEDERTLMDTVRQQGQRAFLQLSIAAIDSELRRLVLDLATRRTEDVVVGDYAYQVEIDPDHEEGGYVAQVAGLPGCITQGDTLSEVLENAEDAIRTYLEAVDELADRGIRLPVKRRRRRRKARA